MGAKRLVAAGVLGAATLGAWVAHASKTWGATPTEQDMELPGDSHIPAVQLVATHGITIDSPPEDIWPWLLQIGQDRGGFYSYEALENAIGCDIEGINEIRPEWQSRNVGDVVRLAPEVELIVGEVIPGQALAFVEDQTKEGPGKGFPDSFSWAFVLVPVGDRRTRLLTRERYNWGETLHPLLRVVPIASCIMTDKLLRTIKSLSTADLV
ncbi:hypothetical protein U6G28_08270 [Actinomycetaceae bacterium MB13-C1-2]|nr:hypothetical protein U6G28_08270 [Actinomycetaceae bacterium MB13-C1-2]